MPEVLKHIKERSIQSGYTSINLYYYQDESRFGLKTFVGRCLSMRGIRPIVIYQHRFRDTYLWGSYSPITGDQFVWEIEGGAKEILQGYLKAFSVYHPKEYKIIIMDNAGFHSLKQIELSGNIAVINIPPYSPELNPAEQVWHHERI